MNWLTLFFVALALSLDNFTIALAVGAQERVRAAAFLRLPLVFAGFAFAAPLAGWLAGSQLAGAFNKYGSLVACAILLYVGLRTLKSAWESVNGGGYDASSLSSTLGLGLATSVDSLTVGLAMALVKIGVLELAALNATLCLVVSVAGLWLGEPIGRRFPMQSRIVAGLVLMALGVRVVFLAKPW